MDDEFIKFAADNGYKGIVIEAMGRGNIPPQIQDIIPILIGTGWSER